jgi:hypothetical protein
MMKRCWYVADIYQNLLDSICQIRPGWVDTAELAIITLNLLLHTTNKMISGTAAIR